jgi:hypothetical protein
MVKFTIWLLQQVILIISTKLNSLINITNLPPTPTTHTPHQETSTTPRKSTDALPALTWTYFEEPACIFRHGELSMIFSFNPYIYASRQQKS